MSRPSRTVFEPISDSNKLDELFTRSNAEPVVIFKHSNTCPISSMAYSQIEHLTVPVSMLTVQSARSISNEIESRTGVRHESPQVIVLRNEKPVWTASHWNISSDAVENAFRENI
jgi:bacillithiol system protein YtxJ